MASPNEQPGVNAEQVVDLLLSKIRQTHLCVHEGDIATMRESNRRVDKLLEEVDERHAELQKIVMANGLAAAKNDEVVRQLGTAMLNLQKIVSQTTIDIATSRAEKRTAIVLASLISGFISSLGSVIAVFMVFRSMLKV